MTDLVPPHGGLSEPLDLQVPAPEQTDFRARTASLKKVPISDADLSTLYRLGVNAFLMGYLPRFEVCGLTLPLYNERIRACAGDAEGRH